MIVSIQLNTISLEHCASEKGRKVERKRKTHKKTLTQRQRRKKEAKGKELAC